MGDRRDRISRHEAPGIGKQSNALVLSDLGVVRTANELQVVEPDAQQTQHQNDKALDNPEPAAEVL